MAELASQIDNEGRILQQGTIQTRIAKNVGEGLLVPRRGKVTVSEGAYLTLSDGTVAGPMVQKNSNGDVYRWWGPRHILPDADDESGEVTLLGTVWLDEQGNAHSDPSPLDAVSLYGETPFW